MKLSRPVLKFLFIITIAYGCWFIVYEFYLKPDGSVDHMTTEYVSIGICRLLHLNGYEAHYTIALKPGETYIYLNHELLPQVRIGSSCNGLELLVLFALFILCYPGNFFFKILYMSGGIIVVHTLNILRNYWLTLLSFHHSVYFNFYHRYLFIFIIYGLIFILWILWANYFSFLKPGSR